MSGVGALRTLRSEREAPPNERTTVMASLVYGEEYKGNAAENYELFFVPNIGQRVAERLMKLAGLGQGERVLDVACGTGVVTRMAANAVGAEGSVTGLDVNPGMLEVARTLAAKQPIEWQEGNAESLPLDDDAFDVVLCQMGLQFVSNKVAALGEMRRVLKQGGRLLLNVPGPTPDLFGELAQALTEYASPKAAGFCHLVFSLNDENELAELGRGAGFREVDVHRETVTLDVAGPEEFLWGYIYSTPLAPQLAELDDESRAAFTKDVVDRWQRFVTPRGMRFEVVMSTLWCK